MTNTVILSTPKSVFLSEKLKTKTLRNVFLEKLFPQFFLKTSGPNLSHCVEKNKRDPLCSQNALFSIKRGKIEITLVENS